MTLVSKIQNVLDETNKRIQDLINSKKFSPEEAEKIVKDATLEIKGITASNNIETEIRSISGSLRVPRRLDIPPVHVDPIPIPDPSDFIPDVHIPTREELEEEARRLARELADAAKAKLVEEAQNAINELRNQIPDPTAQASEMIAEIENYKEQLNSLLEQMNPVALINKALDKAEQICEEYIDSKMVQVFEPLHLKGKSDAEFSLNGTKINAGLTLYLVLGDFEGDFRNNFIKNITVNVELDLADLRLPDPLPTPVINDGNFNVEDEIKRRLEEERDRIIQELVIVIADSYMPVFTVIDKFKDLLKI